MYRPPRKRKPLTAEQQRLAADYLPLAKSLAARYIVRRQLFSARFKEAVRDAAINGLLDAADMFKPDRGLKFVTYARHRIRGAICDGLRAEGRKHQEEQGHDRLTVALLSVSAEDEINGRDEVDRMFRSLPTSHQPYARYAAEGCTQVEISRKLGVAQSRVSYVLNEIRTMLSKEHAHAS